MKYTVVVTQKNTYKWTIDAGSEEEAKYLAKKFLHLSEERSEHFIYAQQVITTTLPETLEEADEDSRKKAHTQYL